MLFEGADMDDEDFFFVDDEDDDIEEFLNFWENKTQNLYIVSFQT